MPRLLDLFCGAGGAAVGYHRAGFTVEGVDLHPQPHYPYTFHQADWLAFLVAGGWRGFDAIHASPPCQHYTRAQNAAQNADAHPDLIAPVRAALVATGLPYVIENVVGAPLVDAVQICGLALGLNVKRHRRFECSFPVMVPPCTGHDSNYIVIFGHECRSRRTGGTAGRKNRIAVGHAAMGIDWMTRGELSEAIPPAYTEHIGGYLADALRWEDAA